MASPTLPRLPKRVGSILINTYCDAVIDPCAQMENGKWCERLGRMDAGRQVVILPGCAGPDRLGQAIPLQSPSNKTTRLAKVAGAGFKPHAQFEGTQGHLLEMGDRGKDFLRSVYGTQNIGCTCKVTSYSPVSFCTLVFGDISNIFSCSRCFVADF